MPTNQLFTERFRLLRPTALDEAMAVIVGCGNLGSAAAIALCRMGFTQFRLWDHDKVEAPNLATQQFTLPDLGNAKVAALSNRLTNINQDVNTDWVHRKFTIDSYMFDTLPTRETTRAICLALTDNLSSRRLVWNSFMEGPSNSLFIDARMGGEFFVINAVTHPSTGEDKNRDAYTSLLFDPPPVMEDPCGASSLGSTGLVVAGFIATIARRWLNTINIPHIITGDLTGTVSSHWATPEENELTVLTERREQCQD